VCIKWFACPSVAVALRGGGGRFLFLRFVGLARGAQFRLLALLTPCRAFGCRNDIDDDLAVVLAALRAGSVRNAGRATFALREALACDSVMAPAFTGLRAIDAHSYYHRCDNIRDL